MEIKKFMPQDHFVRCTIYGWSWVWKTVFGGTAPKPIFASSEAWLLSVVSTLGYAPDYVNITTIWDLQKLYKFLKESEGGEYETLIIDSLTEINEIIKTNMENTLWRGLQIKEWWQISRKIKKIIAWLKALPMHVIIICQEKMVNDEDSIAQIVPMLNGKNATEIAYMMDIVGYMYLDKQAVRHITTDPSPKIVSKDRSGKIWRDASLDFSDWVSAIATLKVGKEKVIQGWELWWGSGDTSSAPDMEDSKKKKNTSAKGVSKSSSKSNTKIIAKK